MVDALVSGASAARRVGSSPILGTRFLRRTTKVARLFFVPCADKGTRTECGCSADLSAVTLSSPGRL